MNNLISRTKIEWADYVWNPVWGCENHCPFCYARKIAKRFAEQIAINEVNYHKRIRNYCVDFTYTLNEIYIKLNYFKPTWLEHGFQKSFPKKPSRIFINSMSDIAYWRPEWTGRVLNKILGYPQHTFIFLTKNPEIYGDYDYPKNCWLGITINKNNDFKKIIYSILKKQNMFFLNFEPLLVEIDMDNIMPYRIFKWVIIGAETGNRQNKIIPEKEWIQIIIDYCEWNRIPIFMKDNLKLIWQNKLIQEYPE